LSIKSVSYKGVSVQKKGESYSISPGMNQDFALAITVDGGKAPYKVSLTIPPPDGAKSVTAPSASAAGSVVTVSGKTSFTGITGNAAGNVVEKITVEITDACNKTA
jgi:hypothetical protein